MNYIDLFAGAGGLSEGFIRAGFFPVAHVEMDKAACDTIKTRMAYHYLKSKKRISIYEDYLKENISKEQLYKSIPAKLLGTVINEKIDDHTLDIIFSKIDSVKGNKTIDLIIGGPPCQAYSSIGRSRDPNKMKGDKRNYLFKYYAEFLKKYNPKFFVFENVIGLLNAGKGYYLTEMKDLFESKEVGYKVKLQILNASDYGVLQARKRVIIIGKKGIADFEYPMPKQVKNKWKLKVDLLSDLPYLNPGDGQRVMNYKKKATAYLEKFEIRNGIDFVIQHVTRPHNDRDLEIYKLAISAWLKEKHRMKYPDLPSNLKTHQNQHSFHDRFKVVNPDGPTHTIVAHIAKDGHYYIYPDLKQVRSISVREAARIQSFPDDYFFEGNRGDAFKQIGNAVPPVMARSIANNLKNMLLRG